MKQVNDYQTIPTKNPLYRVCMSAFISGNIKFLRDCIAVERIKKKSSNNNLFSIACDIYPKIKKKIEPNVSRVFKLLVANGENIHDGDEFALRKAVNLGQYLLVDLLCELGADCNVQQGYCINAAIKNKDSKMFSVLINHGSIVMLIKKKSLDSITNEDFQFVWYLAEQVFRKTNNFQFVVETILTQSIYAEKNYHLFLADSLRAGAVLMSGYLIKRLEWKYTDMILENLSKIESTSVQDIVKNKGYLASACDMLLAYSCFVGDVKLASRCIAAGANVNCDMHKPFLAACMRRNNVKMIKYLIRKKAKYKYFVLDLMSMGIRSRCLHSVKEIIGDKYFQSMIDISLLYFLFQKDTNISGLIYLKKFGSDFNYKYGLPLAIAIYTSKRIEIIKYLLVNGAYEFINTINPMPYHFSLDEIKICSAPDKFIEWIGCSKISGEYYKFFEQAFKSYAKLFSIETVKSIYNIYIVFLYVCKVGTVEQFDYFNGGRSFPQEILNQGFKLAADEGNIGMINKILPLATNVHDCYMRIADVAIYKKDPTLLNILSQSGLFSCDDLDKLLDSAIESGRYEIAEQLLLFGANIRHDHDYLLRSAAQDSWGDTYKVYFLLLHGADPNANYNESLVAAIRNFSIDSVIDLTVFGAKLSLDHTSAVSALVSDLQREAFNDNDENTTNEIDPYFAFQRKSDPLIANILIESQPSLNKESILVWYCAFKNKAIKHDIIDLCFQKGANVKLILKLLLSLALYNKDYELYRYLQKFGDNRSRLH